MLRTRSASQIRNEQVHYATDWLALTLGGNWWWILRNGLKTRLVKVNVKPRQGQYRSLSGVFEFNEKDHGAVIAVRYQYGSSSTWYKDCW